MKSLIRFAVFAFVFLGVCAEDAFARRIKVVVKPVVVRPAVVIVGS